MTPGGTMLGFVAINFLISIAQIDAVKPRQDTTITDWGYTSCGAGWFDVQGQGLKNDYCRWVGNCGCKGECSFWSCALAGSEEQYSPKGKYYEQGIPDSILDHHSCRTVTTIPAHVADRYSLDLDFYAEGKYTEAYGLPITASKDVDDRALMRMCYIVRFLYASHKEARIEAHKSNYRFIVIGKNERTTQMPAYFLQADSEMAKFFDTRARGLGGAVASASEENLLQFGKTSWAGMDLALHEVAHNFHGALVRGLPKLGAEIDNAFTSAKAAGKYTWKDGGTLYGGTNHLEYFATGSASYFGDPYSPPENAHQLQIYDPIFYGVLQKAYACNGPEKFIFQHNDRDQVLSRQSRLMINYPDCNEEPSSNIPNEKDITLKTKEPGVTYTWGRQKCFLPWTMFNRTYESCKGDGRSSWCPTYTEDGKYFSSSERHKENWGYCQNSDTKRQGLFWTPTNCNKTASGKPCIFPFFYLGLKLDTCQGAGWCATKVDGDRNMLEWSTCDASCYSREEGGDYNKKDIYEYKLNGLLGCPEGHTKFGRKCYFPSFKDGEDSVGNKKWTDAQDYCRKLSKKYPSFKYDLVRLQSEEEYNFILNTEWSDLYKQWKSVFGIWIGLNDIDTEGEWKWSDGSELEYGNPVGRGTPPWKEGEPFTPTGTDEDCVRTYGLDGWTNIECSTEMSFLCEGELDLKEQFCYSDKPRNLPDYKGSSSDMTPAVCNEKCKDYAYSGVQSYNQCWCGNDAPPLTRLLHTEACDTMCSGDKNQRCGGIWKVNIIKVDNGSA